MEGASTTAVAIAVLAGLDPQATSRDELRGPLQQIALHAAAGDADAIDALVIAIDAHDLARPAIARQLFDRDDQDDVCQDVLLSVAGAIGGFRGDAHVLTWLHQVATHDALRFVRRRRQGTGSGDELAQLASESARFSSVVSTRADVRAAIDALPEKYRAAVQLRDIDQHSYREVADKLGLNLNTARARIARGRAFVAASLRPNDPSAT